MKKSQQLHAKDRKIDGITDTKEKRKQEQEEEKRKGNEPVLQYVDK